MNTSCAMWGLSAAKDSPPPGRARRGRTGTTPAHRHGTGNGQVTEDNAAARPDRTPGGGCPGGPAGLRRSHVGPARPLLPRPVLRETRAELATAREAGGGEGDFDHQVLG